MRPPVDRSRLEAFFDALGRSVRVPARLYVVGGASVVWLGLRPKTIDIDIAYDVAPGDRGAFVEALRRLKDEMQVNVEEADPGHFLPLPSGHAERARWIGRYGTVDVYHFDLLSTALAKVHRGSETDFADVEALLAAGHVSLGALDGACREILPRMARESLRGDPDRLLRNLEVLARKALRGRSSDSGPAGA